MNFAKQMLFSWLVPGLIERCVISGLIYDKSYRRNKISLLINLLYACE